MRGEGRGARGIEGDRDVTGRGQERVTCRAVLRSVSRVKCRARDRGRWRGRHFFKNFVNLESLVVVTQFSCGTS